MSYQVQIITGASTYILSEHEDLNSAESELFRVAVLEMGKEEMFVKIETVDSNTHFYINKELILEIAIENVESDVDA